MLRDGPAVELITAQLVSFSVSLKNHLRGVLTREEELVSFSSFPSVDTTEITRSLNEAANPPIAAVGALARSIRTGLREDSNSIAAQSYQHLVAQLGNLTLAATACERVKSTPMPYGYVAALRFYLSLWLITLPLTMVGPVSPMWWSARAITAHWRDVHRLARRITGSASVTLLLAHQQPPPDLTCTPACRACPHSTGRRQLLRCP